MSGLSSLPAAAADLVAGLPYRIGIWIGALDLEGGSDINPREIEALDHILHDAAAKHDVTGSIARETLKRKAHWLAWRQSAPKALQDCEATLGALNGVVSHSDLAAFRKWLFAIALGVAESYGEFSANEDHTGAIGRTMNRVTEFVSGHIPSAYPSRISPRETVALEQLKEILRL